MTSLPLLCRSSNRIHLQCTNRNVFSPKQCYNLFQKFHEKSSHDSVRRQGYRDFSKKHTSKLLGTNTRTGVRYVHADKVFEDPFPMEDFKFIPKIKIRWKFGGKFNEEEFLKGAGASFVFITKCIAKGDDEALADLLTNGAKEQLASLMMEAKNNPKEFLIDENDVIAVAASSVNFQNRKEEDDERSTLLSIRVTIPFKKDYRKTPNLTTKTSTGVVLPDAKNVADVLFYRSHLAIYVFQRVYDSDLQNALSGWMVSDLIYRMKPQPEQK